MSDRIQAMTFEVSFCEDSQLKYRICPLINGMYYSPICWGDCKQSISFICNQLNRNLANYLREYNNITPEEICDLMGIK
ncbi:MAG: hypothetical protein HC781_20160 [Leptolyngbyaceae cyanobacterium CSU_1_4]|nr:hypothetical protein [Leptolyngbyaceae cyanobacterium CSU_1_4]